MWWTVCVWTVWNAVTSTQNWPKFSSLDYTNWSYWEGSRGLIELGNEYQLEQLELASFIGEQEATESQTALLEDR